MKGDTMKYAIAFVLGAILCASIFATAPLILSQDDGADPAQPGRASTGSQGDEDGEQKTLIRDSSEIGYSRYAFERFGPIIVRANAFSALARIDAARQALPTPMSLLVDSWLTDHYDVLLVSALEEDQAPTHLVVCFLTAEEQLVVYEHALSEPQREYRFDRFIPVRTATKDDLIGLATEMHSKVETNPYLLVTNRSFANDPEVVRIPDGDIAVGLKYSNGVYSNFIPIDRRPRGE